MRTRDPIEITSERTIAPLSKGRVKITDADSVEILRLPTGSMRLHKGFKTATLACGSPSRTTVVLNGSYAELLHVFNVLTGET